MEKPLGIVFHGMDPQADVEAEIRAQMARIEPRLGKVVTARISVEARHNQHKTGNVQQVHITVSVPGHDYVVSHDPHHAREHRAHPDAMGCVKDAFRALDRQIEARKGGQREHVATAGAAILTGRIAMIEPGADHGFILDITGTQLYFHRDSVTVGKFDQLKPGDAVHYVPSDGDAGPAAAKIRVVEHG